MKLIVNKRKKLVKTVLVEGKKKKKKRPKIKSRKS